jgi:E3 ubiquitin-protein ligase RFWD2
VDLTGKDEEKIKKVQDNFEELKDQFHLVENLDELTKTISTYTKLYRIKEIASFPDCEPLASGSKIISSIESNRNGDMFATAGVLKRINIYNLNNILYNENSNISKNYPISKIECDAKISCLSWNPFYENKLCSADYEGNLNLYDYLTGKLITSWTEHEKRCWSVDSSVLDPNRLISGSDDCKVKLWNQNNQKSIMTINLKANVCSVRFSPKDSNLVAVGAADHRVLLFDLRKPSVPIFNSKEHYKSVSYVRFTESGSSLISASTDSTLRLWTQTGSLAWNPGKVMHGHLNQKNFVGLSNVYNDLIVTGTEENSIAIYNQNLECPVLNYSLRTKCPLTGTIMNDESGTFVSSVSWANRPDIDGNAVLLISNSTGNIRIVSVIQE